MSVPELRPLGVGELLDIALKIWRRHFVTLAKIVLFVVAPVEILSSLLITSVSQDEAFFDTDVGTGTTTFGEPIVDGGDVATFFVGVLSAAILSGLGFLLSSAAALRAVSVGYLGGEPDWKESLRQAWSRFGSLVWLAILMGAGLGIAMLFFFIPFIWLGVAWSLAFVVLVAEGRGGTEALRRSFGLVRRRWWPTFGTLLLALILQTIVEQIVALPLTVLSVVSEPGSIGAFFGLSLSSIVSSVITTPFVAAVFVLLYFDLRVRKEGFDVELLAQAIGPHPPGAWPAEAQPGSPVTGHREWQAPASSAPPTSWQRPEPPDDRPSGELPGDRTGPGEPPPARDPGP